MRTMIGKRIGPVPIALVAVLALAAFISAGLWLVPNGNQNAEAQGFADQVHDPKHVCLPQGNESGDVTTAASDPHDTPVEDQCIAFGDSVTVRFTTTGDYYVVTNGKITDGFNANIYEPGSTGNTATDRPNTTFSVKMVEVPTASIASGTKAEADVTVSRNGKNPIMLWTYAAGTAGVDAALAVGTDDYDPGTPDDVDTVYFVTTRLGRPAGMSELKIADVGDTAGMKVDTKKGESGIITATFNDYQRVVSVGGYRNLATTAAAGQVSYDGTSAFTVMPKATQEESLRAALIPGMYVTVKNVATIYAVSTATPPVTTTTTETTTMTGKIAIGPGSTAGTVAVTLTDVKFSPEERDGTAVATLARVHNVSDTPANDEVSTDVMITVHASRTFEEGTVTFTVEGGDAMLSAASGLVKSTTVQATASQAKDMATGLKVVGLPKNETDPYRVIVKATYSGSTGSLTLTNDSLSKEGPLDSVSAMACGMKDTNTAKDDGCGAMYEPKNRYAPTDDMIMLRLNSSDALGTKLMADRYSVMAATDEMWWESLNCEQMNDAVAGYVMDGDPAVGPDDATSPYCKHFAGTMRSDGMTRADGDADVLSAEALVVVKRAFAAYGDASDAFVLGEVETDNLKTGDDYDTATVMFNDDTDDEDLAGKYLLVVTATKAGAMKYSDLVRVIISGEAENYMIMAKGGDSEIMEDTIGLNGSRTYVLSVTDANGNIPSDEPMVKIALVGEEGFNTSGLLTVEASNTGITTVMKGKVEFTVNSPVNLPINKSAQIRVTTVGGSGLTSLAITFEGRRSSAPTTQPNRAPQAVGSIDDVMFTLGEGSQSMTIDALGNFSDPDSDKLTFSAFSSDTSVATVMADANAGAITVTAVGVGTATITVRASDATHGPATQTFMVTVEAMVDRTLGEAMNLMATGGDGQVTLSWTSGDNADVHWIAGISQSDRAARNYGNMIWTKADGNDGHVVMGLTNGTAYDFAVLSGQMMDDGTYMWSDTWSNLASATPMEAGSGGPTNPFG